MKWVLSAVALLGLALGPASAQVVFQGADKGKPNRMNTITVTEVKGKDFKLVVLTDGKPAEAADYLLLKNEDGQRVIMILTEKEAVFTLVAATNDGEKTFINHHVITIGTPKPTPVPPAPTPPGPTPPTPPAGDLEGKIRAVYNPGLDAATLPKLIAVYEEASAGKYKNYDEMERVLGATATKFLKPDENRRIRDAVASHLVDKVGTDSRRYDVDKVKAVYAEVITVLKKL